ncbi:MAG TPA: histidine kinase [Saprospiraceae bacterium]|nr:histidine kinase [Saprospiraceae bacterium]
MSSKIKQVLTEFLVIAAVGGVFIVFAFGNPFKLYERGGLALLWAYYWRAGVGTATFWMGNAYLSDVPDRWVTWLEAPVKRLVISVLLTIAFTCSAWVIFSWVLIDGWYGQDLWSYLQELTIGDFIPTLIITFLISIFMHGRAFLLNWKETLVEAERLKKEQISARYEALKSQVNPHFLFNSLNVLASLVHKDADQAEQFIRRLSAVYRYILESREREVVPLEEELTILRAYLFLMETRFGTSLQTDIRLPEPAEGQVAPLTLQMLVENALKHNEASKSHPLRIEIFAENGHITVRNNLQPKNALPESTGIGLENIAARYQILSGKPVLITDTDGQFTVKIPLIPEPTNKSVG